MLIYALREIGSLARIKQRPKPRHLNLKSALEHPVLPWIWDLLGAFLYLAYSNVIEAIKLDPQIDWFLST